jgi:hypothetical protein
VTEGKLQFAEFSNEYNFDVGLVVVEEGNMDEDE